MRKRLGKTGSRMLIDILHAELKGRDRPGIERTRQPIGKITADIERMDAMISETERSRPASGACGATSGRSPGDERPLRGAGRGRASWRRSVWAVIHLARQWKGAVCPPPTAFWRGWPALQRT